MDVTAMDNLASLIEKSVCVCVCVCVGGGGGRVAIAPEPPSVGGPAHMYTHACVHTQNLNVSLQADLFWKGDSSFFNKQHIQYAFSMSI